MKFSLINILKYLASLAFALVLLYLAFKNVDLEAFWARTKEVDYTYIYLSIGISVVPYLLRAYRWNLLLAAMGYSQLTTPRTSIAVIVGYLANLALPRMGEITRCMVLQRTERVKFSEGLGTVIVERIVDSITLLLVIMVTFLLEFDKLASFFNEYIFPNYDFSTTQLLLLAFGLFAMGLVGIFLMNKLGKMDGKSSRIILFMKEALTGLKSIKDVRNFWGFVLSSLLIWVAYYFMSYIIVFSLPETSHLGWLAGLALLVTGGIGMAAPVQGGIGTFHLFVSAMLISYGVDGQTGIFLATLLHTSQVLAVVLFGGIALVISFMIKPLVLLPLNQHPTSAQ